MTAAHPRPPAIPTRATGRRWASPARSPIFTQGDQDDFAAGLVDRAADGRYLISVLADGYKLDGEHFTMPLGDRATSSTVHLKPPPLPDATIQAAVFEDISPVNGAPDLPAEHGLAGFSGVVRDTLGEVTTDVYGAPLCGTGVCLSYCYVVNGGVDIGIVEPIDAAGRCPTIPTSSPRRSDRPVVHHRSSGRPAGSVYNASPVPADRRDRGQGQDPQPRHQPVHADGDAARRQNFVQTTTLEGNHDWDAWIMEGATGLDTEFVVAGEPFPAIIFGYTPGSLEHDDRWERDDHGRHRRHEGVRATAATGLPVGGTIFGGVNGGKLAGPIDRPYVALSDLTNGDTAVYVGRGGTNGSFTIPQRARRQLHAQLVGRATGLHPRSPAGDRRQR